MRRREITSSLFWLIVGLLLTVWSATYPLGELAQPGTGFLPLGLGILLLIFSIVLLLRALRRVTGELRKHRPLNAQHKYRVHGPHPARGCLPVRESWLPSDIFFPALVLPLLAGQITWKRSLFFAVLSVVGIYVVFVWLLKQPLPTGLLGL